MEVIRAKKAHDAARFAGDTLSRELLSKADKPTLLLVSGGPSLQIFNFMMGVSARASIQIGQVDERWATNDQDLNSYAFRKTAFAKLLAERGVPFVFMETLSRNAADESAWRYGEYLKQWRGIVRDGTVMAVFDIGDDGHIAGIMPYSQEKELFEKTFLNTKRWAVGYETGGYGGFSARVTLTLHYLMQEIDFSIAYACGEEKRQAVLKTLAPEGKLAETPARILNEMRNVHLFTDIA